MKLEDETIGLRSRLFRLRQALRSISEPLAVAIVEGVIADIETRIAAVERARECPKLKPATSPQTRPEPEA